MADSHSHPCPESLEQPLKGWLPFKLTSSAIKLLAEQDLRAGSSDTMTLKPSGYSPA
jgi:hypothetical protein